MIKYCWNGGASMSKKQDLYNRAMQLAQAQIEKNIKDLGDEKLTKLAHAIVLTNAIITAQLIAEYDENKEIGNM